LYNNTEFWENSLHAMKDEDFWDLIDVYDIQKQQYPEEFYRFPKQSGDMDYIRRRLMLGKPVVRPMQKSANTPVFRALMVTKDVINNVNGKPTVNYKDLPADTEVDDKPTQFEKLFNFN